MSIGQIPIADSIVTRGGEIWRYAAPHIFVGTFKLSVYFATAKNKETKTNRKKS